MKVLIADSETDLLSRMVQATEGVLEGWNFEGADSGSAAVSLLRESSFDAVIADLSLKDLDAAALLQHVRENYPDSVRIAVMADPASERSLRSSAVAHQFALKHSESIELVQTILHSCELHSMIRGEKIQSLAERLGELPVQPKLYSELMVALGDPEIGMVDIGNIIEKDVAISAKLLQVANSSSFSLRTEVQTVQHAVNFMGARMVASIVLSLEAAAAFPVSRGSDFSIEQFNDHATFVGVVARGLLKENRVESDDAFVAGMMHDVGKLMMAARLPGEVGEIDQPGAEVSHGMLGAYLLSAWGFRYPVVQGVAFHHCPELADGHFGIATAIHVADAIAHEVSGAVASAEELMDLEHLENLGLLQELDAWKEEAAALV